MKELGTRPDDISRPDRRKPRNRLRPATLIAPTIAFLVLPFIPPIAALAQDCITELAVVHGGSGTPAPAGFTRINVDLNQGAGGDYVYLCYKRGVGAPITGLAVTLGNGAPPAGAVQTRINVDLNVGAGGDYVWLWYTRDPACATVRDLHVQANTAAPPAGFTRIDVDLNRNAGGAYIYLSYRKL